MSCPSEETILIPKQFSRLRLVVCFTLSRSFDPAISASFVQCKMRRRKSQALPFSVLMTFLVVYFLPGKILAWQSGMSPAHFGAIMCNLSASRGVRSPSSFNKRQRRVSHHSMIAPQQLGSFEALNVKDDASRKVLLEDWTARSENINSSSSLVDFEEAWTIQREYLQQHFERLKQQQQQDTNEKTTVDSFYHSGTTNSNGVDRIIFLEHRPVYTLGIASDASLVLDIATGISVVRMDRGGEVTYHGPGQLTVYPVIDLRHYRQDIHWYVRALEEAVLGALELCLDRHGRVSSSIQPERDESFTGVFVPGYGKIAAVGIKCRRWITQHGVAINVTPDSLPPFQGIVPCGLTGEHGQVTCVNDLVKEHVSVQQMAGYMQEALERVLAIEWAEERTRQRWRSAV